jgi:uncharacterized membrane protein
MIVMALDHVRDFTHNLIGVFNPEDLAKTTTVLFLTRWVTHICAPVFMFTAGIGAYWWLSRHGRTPSQLTAFLWKRGFWLIVLELTLFRFVISFSLFSGPVLLVVLWALGVSMIALGLLVHLPIRVLAVVSVAMIALHNLADPVRDARWWWLILHQRGAFQAGPLTVVAGYPLIPWIFVMSSGYCFGAVLKEKSAAWILKFGAALTLGFVVLRWINVYGDPVKWDGSFLSFLLCNKYPPSLLFLLMTLGPALMLLGWFGRMEFSLKNPLIVFGRTPLFYFIGHLYLARLVSLAIPGGVGLAGVYGIWIAVVAAMYPVCRWFMGVKERRSHWWLAYL